MSGTDTLRHLLMCLWFEIAWFYREHMNNIKVTKCILHSYLDGPLSHSAYFLRNRWHRRTHATYYTL